MQRLHGPRLYGRQVGHGGLRPSQQALLMRAMPAIELNEDGPTLDTKTLFDEAKELWLEIGFGAGEHLAWQAENNADIGMIGVEPFITGVAKCLAHIEAGALNNVRLCAGDARRLLSRFPDQSITRVFVLHPDPWPKWRHARRRLIQTAFLEELARVMVPGGLFRLGTDWPDYSAWALHHVLRHRAFEWPAKGADDWRQRPADWPITRYAEKAALEGRRDAHFTFLRRNDL
ncbi:MAG: tRNA (guanosine(46)-N7)-methyltransferase TrmB [Pseudomonadota bacterium]